MLSESAEDRRDEPDAEWEDPSPPAVGQSSELVPERVCESCRRPVRAVQHKELGRIEIYADRRGNHVHLCVTPPTSLRRPNAPPVQGGSEQGRQQTQTQQPPDPEPEFEAPVRDGTILSSRIVTCRGCGVRIVLERVAPSRREVAFALDRERRHSCPEYRQLKKPTTKCPDCGAAVIYQRTGEETTLLELGGQVMHVCTPKPRVVVKFERGPWAGLGEGDSLDRVRHPATGKASKNDRRTSHTRWEPKHPGPWKEEPPLPNSCEQCGNLMPSGTRSCLYCS